MIPSLLRVCSGFGWWWVALGGSVGWLGCPTEPTASAETPPGRTARAPDRRGARPTIGADNRPSPDAQNRGEPARQSDDLTARARHLFDAIAKNEPSLADDFFFPKAPFIPLKDVADPARYFDQLLATFHRDIAGLHGQRKDWTATSFVSFELGSPPGWVAPGKEYNHIGYFRTFGGKLRYQVGDHTAFVRVSTVISWDDHWYVTHLSPIAH